MGKFRKKPVEIEAIQFDGDRETIEKWVTENGGQVLNWYYDGERWAGFHIYTLEGLMEANLGDFIIKGIKGEFYPCKPDIFRDSYDEIVAEGSN